MLNRQTGITGKYAYDVGFLFGNDGIICLRDKNSHECFAQSATEDRIIFQSSLIPK